MTFFFVIIFNITEHWLKYEGGNMLIIPVIMGKPLHLWLGLLLFLLIVFQILVAKRIVSIPFRWHRIMGYVILLIALIHGSIAIGLYTGIFRL